VILVVQAYIGSRTSALMSTAQQIAMSTCESSSISVPVSLGDAMVEQAVTQVQTRPVYCSVRQSSTQVPWSAASERPTADHIYELAKARILNVETLL
jgi:hypothetical protein